MNRLWRMSTKGGKKRIHRSKTYTDWIRQADLAWLEQKSPGRPQCINNQFSIKISYFNTSKHRPDIDNLQKALLDFLQRIELIRDDSGCAQCLTVWGGKADTRHCVVEIEELLDVAAMQIPLVS